MGDELRQQGVSTLVVLTYPTFIQHTPTHNFGTIGGCVIDIYFHYSCVKLLL